MTEAKAKKQWKKEVLKSGRYSKVFFIETEETEAGFPDCIALGANGWDFIEHKVTIGSTSVFKFQKSQPIWYVQNKSIPVILVVYNNTNNQFEVFPSALEVVKTRMKSNFEVTL